MTESIEGIDVTAVPSGDGCAECTETGGWWLHLRRCTQCGHIGCCDSSPSQHASKHAAAEKHPLIRSFEPGEDWFWDYTTNSYYEGGPELAPPLEHPRTQTTPGPADRVPSHWRSQLH